MTTGKFSNSLWINLENTARSVDSIYNSVFAELNLEVIEAYILRALFEQDGQRASDLARLVGRPATSFTPLLDGLQNKNLLERRADPKDRRAVRIFLTTDGEALRQPVEAAFNELDSRLANAFSAKAVQDFQEFLLQLQQIAVAPTAGWQMEVAEEREAVPAAGRKTRTRR
ncbi:MAG TPA: MarR family transcriptional regulator [Phototrophicaceae bacterium]|nr:MarR family transcriptional regulator [Phototrophicaceae bacterium]